MKTKRDKVWVLGGGYSILRLFGVPLCEREYIIERRVPLSLLNQYLQIIKNQFVIGVNKAYKINEIIDIAYFIDSKFFDENKDELKKLNKPIYTICDRDEKLLKQYGITKLKKSEKHAGIDTRKWHVCGCHNSGLSAINLAYHLGASKIMLLGFDMKASEGRYHFHSEYKQDDEYKKALNIYLKNAEVVYNDCKALGLQVYNVTDDSDLPLFEKITLKKALEI